MAHTLDSFPDTGNLENLKDNYQKITSVLAGHQIAFWEYDIPTGECNFTDEYFHILGLKEAGIIFRDINDFIGLPIRRMLSLTKRLLRGCLNRKPKSPKLWYVV